MIATGAGAAVGKRRTSSADDIEGGGGTAGVGAAGASGAAEAKGGGEDGSAARTRRHNNSTSIAATAMREHRRGGKPIRAVRDLDPHLSNRGSVPTQRMHSNWPDGLRRHLARHFYGMAPAKILEEEAKERMCDLRSYRTRGMKEGAGGSCTEDTGIEGDDGSGIGDESVSAAIVISPKAKAQAKARKRALERFLALGDEAGMMHRIEVRVRNSECPQRVMVGRRVQHKKGPEESGRRPCSILGPLHANPKPLPLKY